MIRPLKDNILIENLDQGRETVTKGGIILPATLQARAKTKADLFRAKVVAKGPDAPRELEIGSHVLVHTWADGDGSKLYTGENAGTHQRFIKPDDIVCEVAADAVVG